jgi:hypothetical protein
MKTVVCPFNVRYAQSLVLEIWIAVLGTITENALSCETGVSLE